MALAAKLLVLSLLLTAFGVGGASAETPTRVVEDTSIDGVYIAPSRKPDFDKAVFLEAVAAANEMGITLIVVVPFEAQPSTTAFALRTRQAADVDVAIVFGPDGVFAADVSEDYEDVAIRALNAARVESTPQAQVDTFMVDLTTEPERSRPEMIDTVVRWAILLTAGLLAAASLEWLLRQAKKARRRATLHKSQSAADKSAF